MSSDNSLLLASKVLSTLAVATIFLLLILRIVAAATNRGRRLFCSALPEVRLLFEGGDESRAASDRKNTVYVDHG